MDLVIPIIGIIIILEILKYEKMNMSINKNLNQIANRGENLNEYSNREMGKQYCEKMSKLIV